MPLTSAYAVRGFIAGRARPLSVRGHRARSTDGARKTRGRGRWEGLHRPSDWLYASDLASQDACSLWSSRLPPDSAAAQGGRGDRAVLAKLGAYLGSVGVAQVLQDVQGLLPGVLGGGQVRGGGAGVTEAGQGVGLAEELAEIAQDVQGVLVIRSGLIQAAELVLGVAQAVPDLGLADAVAGVTVHSQGLPAERPGLLWAAEQEVVPADGVEGEGLAGLVGGVPEQAEGLLFVAERIGVTALVLGDPAQGVAGEGLAGAVAELSA